jgi:hypothetical protein
VFGNSFLSPKTLSQYQATPGKFLLTRYCDYFSLELLLIIDKESRATLNSSFGSPAFFSPEKTRRFPSPPHEGVGFIGAISFV